MPDGTGAAGPDRHGVPHSVTEGVRLLSQLQSDYRRSPLSEDGDTPRPGRPRAGDRLHDATVACNGREAFSIGRADGDALRRWLERVGAIERAAELT